MELKDFLQSKIAAGMSQADIARKCGLSPGTVSNIMIGGMNTSVSTRLQIAKGFGLELNYFLDDETLLTVGMIGKNSHSIPVVINGGDNHHVDVVQDQTGLAYESGSTVPRVVFDYVKKLSEKRQRDVLSYVLDKLEEEEQE